MGFWDRFQAEYRTFSSDFGSKPGFDPVLPTFYEHWRDVPLEDGLWAKRWPNFSPVELACPQSGRLLVDPHALDSLQATRTKVGVLRVNSAHRSPRHNAAVGGAPASAHLALAFDLSLEGHTREQLFLAARISGFTSFGFYRHFLHVDTRPGRRWFGRDPQARQLWEKALGPAILRW